MTSRIEAWLGSDKVTRLLGILTLLLVVSMMVLAGFTIPDIASNTDASRRTDDLASCRAEYANDVNDAIVALFTADSQVQSGIATAVVNAIRQDPVLLDGVARQIEEAQLRRVETIVALDDATRIRADAIALSQSDPDAFLDRCKNR